MLVLYNHEIEAKQYRKEISGTRIRIGRDTGNDIVLNNKFIAPFAAVVEQKGDAWVMNVLGLNPVEIEGQEFKSGDSFELTYRTAIKIFPFDIILDLPRKEEVTRKARLAEWDRQFYTLINTVHTEILRRTDFNFEHHSDLTEQLLEIVEKQIEEITKEQGLLHSDHHELADHLAGHTVRSEMISDFSALSGRKKFSLLGDLSHWSRLVLINQTCEQELREIKKRIEMNLNLSRFPSAEEQINEIERDFWDQWESLVSENRVRTDTRNYLAVRHVKKTLKDLLFGYGPLEDLLRLPTVTEIMVVSSDRIFIEKGGRIENSGRTFLSDEITVTVINRITSKVNRHIDKAMPLVDARLTDGSRVNAVIEPLAISGPCLTIRKFPEQRLLVDDLIRIKSITPSAAEFLRSTILNRRNIIVSGGTGTGKTTLLNCLSDFIPNNERIVTIEDTAELRLAKQHVVRLEAKKANAEGAGEFTIRDLVRNALRMRPDRIVVGECRGAEALDMLQAMNTGHDGSLTTLHANNTADVILRLEVLVQMAFELPIHSIHQQIASAVDLVVQLKRMRNGRRCVSQISEIKGIDPTNSDVIFADLFVLENESDDEAELIPTGSLPTFMDVLIERNLITLQNFYI